MPRFFEMPHFEAGGSGSYNKWSIPSELALGKYGGETTVYAQL